VATGELKKQIDRLWLEFWQGGISNPLVVIEQITFLMFSRMLDINETRDEKRQNHTGKSFQARFNASEQNLRWSNYVHTEDPDQLMKLVRDDVFKHIREHTGDTSFGDFMKDARLAIDKPGLLQKAVRMIDKLPLVSGDAKGDLYEYLLSKLTTAGINGQFRTPRHIINMMVQLVDPQPYERVADPSVGTAGFLVSALEYVIRSNTSKDGVIEEMDTLEDGTTETTRIYTGDMLEPEQWTFVQSQMLHGFDFDATMLRIAAMNLVMHGAQDPNIHYQDTLSQSFIERFPTAAKAGFDVVLANPPFKGALDEDTTDPALLRITKTRKTELLFVARILSMLKLGGRSATIVPDGVLFGSSRAHQALRKHLLEDNQLEAVISLPSGVFKPYAGVSTAALVFTKGGKTEDVFFYDVQNDGFSLDDKRNKIEENDLPNVIEQHQLYKNGTGQFTDRTQKAFVVTKGEIVDKGYDLSLNSYKETEYELVDYDPPKMILKRLAELEKDIAKGTKELEGMLSC